jgi:Cu-Zn family superoxide dismutase
MSRFISTLTTATIAAATLAACANMTPDMDAQERMTATAVLAPTRGNTASGTVTFEQIGEHVVVKAKVGGLAPNSVHAMHAHEFGDCSSGDGMSTGGHFNPLGKPHGPQDGEHHAGDMPELRADALGNASATFVLGGVTVGSGATNLVGHGLIIHAGVDDFHTQPTGNSGARIACGVIEPAHGTVAAY